jgi:hypothetical protein
LIDSTQISGILVSTLETYLGQFMESWFSQLIKNCPHLSTDGIRLLLYVAEKGPLVPVSSLPQALEWDKPRLAKVINELAGKSQKKSWLNRNAGSDSPALLREDLDPSDLRAKTISLTPLGSTFAHPEKIANPRKDISVAFSKTRLSIIERSTKEISNANRFLKNESEITHYCENSRALADIAILSLDYLEARAEDSILNSIDQLNSLLSWVTVEALKADANSASRFSTLAKTVIERISRNQLENEIEEKERFAKLVGFTHATLRVGLCSSFGFILDSELSKLERIKSMHYEDLKSLAEKCSKAYSLVKPKIPAMNLFFFEKYANNSIEWLILVDKFRAFSTLDISLLYPEDIKVLVEGNFEDVYINPSVRDHLISELKGYYFNFPENGFTFWYEQSMNFSRIASHLNAFSNSAFIVKTVHSALEKSGISAFINSDQSRNNIWINGIVDCCIKGGIVPIIYKPSAAFINILKSNNGKVIPFTDGSIIEFTNMVSELIISAEKEDNKFTVIVPDGVADYLNIMREVHENPLLNKAHFHILFDYLPLPFTPYTSLAESLSNIEFSALLWGKLSGLGVGLITDSDYHFLINWCLGRNQYLPPLNFQALSKMPIGRFVEFSEDGWIPKAIS